MKKYPCHIYTFKDHLRDSSFVALIASILTTLLFANFKISFNLLLAIIINYGWLVFVVAWMHMLITAKKINLTIIGICPYCKRETWTNTHTKNFKCIECHNLIEIEKGYFIKPVKTIQLTDTKYTELSNLKKLLDQKIITDQEYLRAKEEVLSKY